MTSLGDVLKGKIIYQRSTMCVNNFVTNAIQFMLNNKTFNSEITGFFKLRFKCIFCLALSHPRKILLQSKNCFCIQFIRNCGYGEYPMFFVCFSPLKPDDFPQRCYFNFLFSAVNELKKNNRHPNMNQLNIYNLPTC